ncbi:hypothetical protein [Leifsonia sp. NPDC058248]|uniref:hypothetical protein n=1 Tax=Leifsonia sp. NPDC058248 TaxID=3346402 RepID=UPI0036DB9824
MIAFVVPNLAGSDAGFAAVVGLVALAIVAAVVVIRMLAARARWASWLRLDRFAGANAMTFWPVAPAPGYAGSIFQQGRERSIRNRLTSTAGRFVDLATYRYVTGSGKSRQEHEWGYLAIRLDHALPHILLDARSNNGLFGGTNLPAEFSRSQRLSLEGDFDRYFTLYCPKDYERDALYLLTPDLMALLIDEAQDFDVEIVDDWLFVYASRALDLTDPAVTRRMFRILGTVGAKATGRADRYSDDRQGAVRGATVAPQGRRLRRAFPVVGVTIGAILAVWWLANVIWIR